MPVLVSLPFPTSDDDGARDSTSNFSAEYKTGEEAFYAYLGEFFVNEFFKRHRADVILEDNSKPVSVKNKIKYARMGFRHTPMATSEEQVVGYQESFAWFESEVARVSGLDIQTHTMPYQFYDQYAAIWMETFYTFLWAACGVFGIAIMLIPSFMGVMILFVVVDDRH